MTNLSTQPYKGTRDYYPADKRLQNYIFNTWRRVVESFGYEEYGAPILEPLGIYAAKSGADLVNDETYRFTDRSDREVAIRPEMTPTVARMVAGKQQETPYPARWYSIANFMRYERPQKGREREFWQLNVDLFGVESVDADVEIITIANQIMQSFGAKPKMYTIRINHRRLIDFMMKDYLGLDVVQSELMVKLFDKKNKITPHEFKDKVLDILDNDQAEAGLEKIAKLFRAKTVEELPQAIRENEAFAELNHLFVSLTEAGVKNAQFDIGLMRGLDYYNGIVFEVFDTHPDNNRAMFGGGRYDGLTTVFGAENIPVVGMAPGATTIEEFLKAHNLLPHLSTQTEVYVVVLGEKTLQGALKVAAELRAEEVNVEVDITGRKLEKQLKTGLKKQIPFLLFIGEQELEQGQYNLKITATGKEQNLSLERIVTTVKDQRVKGSQEDDF